MTAAATVTDATLTDATVDFYGNTANAGDTYILVAVICLFLVAVLSRSMFRKMFNALRRGEKVD